MPKETAEERRPRRPLRLGEPQVHTFNTDDNFELKLTRCEGGNKGPVILTPGYGTSTLAFALDTVETNFPEYLYARGYDVWLFDYRSSPAVESSRRQFTVDDVATHDYPAAVRKVRELTGASDVQVTAHCVGSLSFVMSLTAGLKGIRSAVCSQIALHPMVSSMVKAKTALRLATIVKALGPDFIATAHDDSKLSNRLLDKAMDHYPGAARCGNPVCDRILCYYGETYEHAQLNEETHAIVADMFGTANLTTFEHMARIINAGHAVDAQGEEAYLPNVANAAVPIAFIHGEKNNFFVPEGTKRTYDLLCRVNGPELYSRHVFPGYAHMDCFIGKDAANDIFPLLHQELERFN